MNGLAHDGGGVLRGGGDPLSAWMEEIAPFGIFTTDTELRIRSWNQWLATRSGLQPESVIGKPLFALFPDLESRGLHLRFVRALQGEISVLSTALHRYLLPLQVTEAAGGPTYMLQTARIAPLPGHGSVEGTITVIEDVTQREVQAQVLRRQQELDRLLSHALAALLQSATPAQDLAAILPTITPSLGLDMYASYVLDQEHGMLTLTVSGGILPVRRAALAAVPVAGPDRLGATSFVPNLPATTAHHQALLQRMGFKGSWTFPLGIGERVIGLLSFGSYQRETIALGDEKTLARITRYVGIAMDRAERERDVIAASNAKDDFVAALSHELRTPLNPVLLLASESALNPDYPSSARDAFRMIEKNALLEARLIDDLLDLTRIERGKLSLDLQRVDLHAVVRDAVATVHADALERGITVEKLLVAERSAVIGDAARLQQVFWNVLKNAIKFTPPAGVIRVGSRLLTGSNRIELSVSDTGIGLEPHEIRRIFDAFTQGDHAERRGHRFGGLGLGLAISRNIIELHSGSIEATSEGRNLGSTFTVTLPLAAPRESETKVSPAVSADSARPIERSGRPHRILLVEDHEPTRTPLAGLLVRRGFDVVAVGSAEEALVAAQTGAFEIVLSDIGLPGQDGYSLMRTMRSRYGAVGIALTGFGMEEDLARSRDAGFVDHLTKPIRVKVLERALEKAITAIL